MSEAKHTPEPWTNDGGLVNGRESRARYAPGVSLDIFDASQWPVELESEALANAALIAAAPRLLAALNDLLADCDDVLDGKLPEISATTLTRARQARANATA